MQRFAGRIDGSISFDVVAGWSFFFSLGSSPESIRPFRLGFFRQLSSRSRKSRQEPEEPGKIHVDSIHFVSLNRDAIKINSTPPKLALEIICRVSSTWRHSARLYHLTRRLLVGNDVIQLERPMSVQFIGSFARYASR